ncbi:adenine deaminase C-terminal domain-containing protein [Pseudogracilibacillus auburnensis]|uniref:adenine deaminase n=1 Tax=Pseudogracilibacillus auburnensis TaxID=1494959 RepID=A0A2V3WAR2_9BACI|nr:adenine deaminase C-terminal domain-containing protein [Pseudogracilibacillus auburnensis]PXW90616.1 adenine deaminase [Pseudogracilibacillus auburnensis]
MLEQGQFWRNRELRAHVAVVEGNLAPTIVFKNSTYLNVFMKTWLQANIWIYKDRIIYVGDRMPEETEGTEIIDCTGQYLVPGYIEPHAHPFIVYNPEELAYHAATYGTTTLINDNMRLLSLFDKKKAFAIINDLHQLPISMFWWGRYDSQSMLRDEDTKFNTNDILTWMSHPAVVQGGELTSWPQLLAGDDRLLYWIQETKRLKKRVEGHFPGASEKTLTKLKLLGASADHEAMSGKEAIRRLQLGYHVALRYSSIRPDLPKILDELLAENVDAYDQMMLTTDGSTPAFTKRGLMNICIEIALEKGVPLAEAYRMATYNIAKYYGMDELLGSIAPGRLAHINILYEKNDPTPLSVMAKGKWILKDGVETEREDRMNWKKHDIKEASFNWELNDDDLQFSIPIGLKMVNDVIMKPYAVDIDITTDYLPKDSPDAFLLFIDRYGKWRVNTVISGFTKELGALCSTFSTTDDIILIGKKKSDMKLAWSRMKEIGGGIVLAHEGTIIYELPLKLEGAMYEGNMETLIDRETKCKQMLIESGYEFNDPIYNLLFLSSTHLPYIRVTQQGIVDVMKHETIVPANMR